VSRTQNNAIRSLADDDSPYWRGCGRQNGGEYGLNDPPHAIEQCTSDDCLIPDKPQTPVENPDVTTTAAPVVPTIVAPIEKPTRTESPVVPPVVTEKPVVPETTPISAVPETPVPETPVETSTVPEPTVPVVISPVESNGQPTQIPNTPVGSPASSIVIIPIPPASVDPASPAPASSSGIIIGTQTAIIGGPAITVPGSGVATANPSGILIAYPDGVVINLPASSSPALPSEVAIVPVAGNSPLTSSLAIVVGGQTATIGGAAVTLSGDVVASAASGGLVVKSGGVVSTIPVVSAPTGVTGAHGNGTATTTTEAVRFTGGAGVLGVGAGGLVAGIAAVFML